MSEVITFNSLLQRMLDRVPDTVDKREGSIIYDALAPAAAELVQAYIELEGYLDLVFVDTSAKGYLTRLCSQFGVDRQPATYAVRKASFKNSSNNPFNVPIGSRYTIDTLSYSVIEKIGEGLFFLRCESSGTIGNTSFGKLIPIDYIEGLASAELEDVLIPGEEEETDDQLKERYFEYIKEPAFGGNIADYKRKVKALEGVGGVKVFPIWNGEGTVKLVLIDSEYNLPTETLINEVYESVSPSKSDEGFGIAPIGHTVTILGANATSVNISTNVSLLSGYSQQAIKEEIQEVLEKYLLDVRKGWEDSESLIVRLAHIDSRILDIQGVLDVSATKLNNAVSNLNIAADNVPVIGSVVMSFA